MQYIIYNIHGILSKEYKEHHSLVNYSQTNVYNMYNQRHL